MSKSKYNLTGENLKIFELYDSEGHLNSPQGNDDTKTFLSVK